VIVVNGAKAIAGEDNTRLLFQLLLRLVHRAIQAQQALPEPERRRVALYVDEAHNVLTPTVATMLAEGRSAGLEACFAWQYSAQIRDALVRSGVRSLLQSISIFRMREMEDARSLAGLAMDVYSDRISVDREEQERLRFSADDIVRLPVHTAINLWVARGTPRTGFYARTLPMEELYDRALAGHHLAAQRERGGHYLAHLPAPPAAETRNGTQPNGTGLETDGGGGDVLQLPDRRRPGGTDE
jgi:TraM recognition site of TraD and TraG